MTAPIISTIPTLAELDSIVDWMRARGVSRLSAAGMQVDLGAEPTPAPKAEEIVAEAEQVREGERLAARIREDDERWDYLASEGAPPDWQPRTWPAGGH